MTDIDALLSSVERWQTSDATAGTLLRDLADALSETRDELAKVTERWDDSAASSEDLYEAWRNAGKQATAFRDLAAEKEAEVARLRDIIARAKERAVAVTNAGANVNTIWAVSYILSEADGKDREVGGRDGA